MSESDAGQAGELSLGTSRTTRLGGRAVAIFRLGLLVFLAAGVVQIFLAGLGAFRLLHGAGDSALDPHRTLGFAMGGMAIILLILALIARPGARVLVGMVLLVLLTSFVQSLLAGLADHHAVYGALHATDGLLILAIPTYLYFWSGRQAA